MAVNYMDHSFQNPKIALGIDVLVFAALSEKHKSQ